MKHDSWTEVKEKLGKYAASQVPDMGIIGLGTGSTASAFIHALGERHRTSPLTIQCVATSQASEILALECGLPVLRKDWPKNITITFDGADAVVNNNELIKGGGGAFLREKIVAKASKRFVCMVDERKLSVHVRVPVAIIPFGGEATMNHIHEMGYKGTIRMHEGEIVYTDDGLWIFDIGLPTKENLQEIDLLLKQIPGVVDTGVFYHMATSLIIGYENGHIEEKKFEQGHKR